MKKHLIFLLFVAFLQNASSQNTFEIALLKYNGGGDWYANPTALPNLINYVNENLNTEIDAEPVTVEVGSEALFNYPFVHMTGHGNVVFSAQEAENLRNYLISGGFLHVSDNYGMNPYFRAAIKTVFPEEDLVEMPFPHEIFHQTYKFKNGLPKIHQHDDLAPKAYGIFYKGRLVLFYDFECDLSDGWEDQAVHNDSQNTREKALQMGSNILQYVFSF